MRAAHLRTIGWTLAGQRGWFFADAVEYLERDWSAEEFTRGCYGAHLPPGAPLRSAPAGRGLPA